MTLLKKSHSNEIATDNVSVDRGDDVKFESLTIVDVNCVKKVMQSIDTI
jgi:hypothetical protein